MKRREKKSRQESGKCSRLLFVALALKMCVR